MLPDTRGIDFFVWITACSHAQMRDEYFLSDDTIHEISRSDGRESCLIDHWGSDCLLGMMPFLNKGGLWISPGLPVIMSSHDTVFLSRMLFIS